MAEMMCAAYTHTNMGFVSTQMNLKTKYDNTLDNFEHK